MIKTVERYLDTCSLSIQFAKGTVAGQYIMSIRPGTRTDRSDLPGIPPMILKGTIDELENELPAALERAIGFNKEVLTNLVEFEEALKNKQKENKKTTSPGGKKSSKPADTTDKEDAEEEESDNTEVSAEDKATAPFDMTETEKAPAKEEKKAAPAKIKLTKEQKKVIESIEKQIKQHNEHCKDAERSQFTRNGILKAAKDVNLPQDMTVSYLSQLKVVSSNDLFGATEQKATPAPVTTSVVNTAAPEVSSEPIEQIEEKDEDEDNPDESLQKETPEEIVEQKTEVPKSGSSLFANPADWL